MKDFTFNIVEDHNCVFVNFTGELTKDTLFSLYQNYKNLIEIKPKQIIYWNMQNLENIDSAGFMLLVEILAFYQSKTQNKLINTKEMINNLATLFNLEAWLKNFYLM